MSTDYTQKYSPYLRSDEFKAPLYSYRATLAFKRQAEQNKPILAISLTDKPLTLDDLIKKTAEISEQLKQIEKALPSNTDTKVIVAKQVRSSKNNIK